MTKIKNEPGNEGFVSRWSRLKQQPPSDQDGAGHFDEESVQTGEDSPALQAERTREKKRQELNALKDEDMPELDSLDEHSDFSQFMSVNVSEGLRNLALRKLFQGEGYNIRDGLDEYDDDYTSFEKLDPTTITADMRHRMQVEAEKREAAKEQEEKEGLGDTDLSSDEPLPENRETSNAGEEDQEPDPGLDKEQVPTGATDDLECSEALDNEEAGENAS